jgi:hypothetical protein
MSWRTRGSVERRKVGASDTLAFAGLRASCLSGRGEFGEAVSWRTRGSVGWRRVAQGVGASDALASAGLQASCLSEV